MPADLSPFAYFAPIVTFLLVFVIVYAVLAKIKIITDNYWINLFIAFFVATLFISLAGAREYIELITPWFSILIISVVFLGILIGFIGKPVDFLNKWVGIVSVILLTIIFLVSAFFVFSKFIVGYLPGEGFGYNANPDLLPTFAFLYSPRISGAIILIGVSALVSWILFKAKDSK
ncbi:MAG: hypothetical protein AABY05_01130 [Nanoarchaeota archaeon]